MKNYLLLYVINIGTYLNKVIKNVKGLTSKTNKYFFTLNKIGKLDNYKYIT